ncbi:MAG TPA: tetratricopeptide repeat-containing sensor histidine kinase [Puia sp.]|nr:tetratricopeptide repeat-containing sensor histidine kinase [Puia sp.]
MKNNLVAVTACFWLITLSFTGFSQKKGAELIDSLQKEASRPGEDTNKVLTLARLAGAWSLIDLNKAFPPANEALRLSQKLHWLRGIANMENNLGMYMSDTGNTVDSRKHFEISYKLNVQRDSKINVVNNLLNIGRTYSYESDFPKAVDYFFKALTIAEAIKSEQKMALVGNNLASNFFKQHNFKKTLEYGLYTVDHAAKGDDPSSMVKGLGFTGDAQAGIGDTLAAIRSLDSAIAVARRADLRLDLSEALGDRALLESNLEKKIRLLEEDDQLMEKVNPNSAAHVSLKASLGSDYLQLAKQTAGPSEKARLLKNADKYLTSAKAMAESRKNPARLAEVLQMMAALEEYQGRYQAALADHKRMEAINDSLFSQDNKNQIAGLEAKHTVALKDAELTLSQVRLSDQRKTTLNLITGLVCLAIFFGLLYWQSRSRKKANAALQQTNRELEAANRELEEANHVKARFFGILSHDLRGPVSHLLHFLEIQKEAPHLLAGAQQESQRRQITDSAENLLNTMEGMLLWSKQQMQSFRPIPKSTPVDELFDYLQKFFTEPGPVSLMFQAAGDLTVFTDENYLRVIMQNLTSNAIKAVKDRPDATIEWNAKNEGNNTVLSIADNGPGLSSEHREALYEESAAENARDGFGLHIIRDLAKAIHCRLDVRSEPGKGTIFSLILPAAV